MYFKYGYVVYKNCEEVLLYWIEWEICVVVRLIDEGKCDIFVFYGIDVNFLGMLSINL